MDPQQLQNMLMMQQLSQGMGQSPIAGFNASLNQLTGVGQLAQGMGQPRMNDIIAAQQGGLPDNAVGALMQPPPMTPPPTSPY